MYATGSSNLGTTSTDGFCSVTLNSINPVVNDLTAISVSVSISFQQDYPGVYGPQTYGVQTQIVDSNGFQTSWGNVGTWTVDQIPLGPWSGSGNIQTFTISAADPAGQSATNINNVQLILNDGPYLIDGCYLNYDAANDLLYLADKTGNFSFSPISLKTPGGTLGDLTNANCQINGPASSISAAGTSLYLNLKVTFSSTFIGLQQSYVQVSDTLATNQPVFQGSWTAYAASSTGPSNVLPTTVDNDGTGTTTFGYSDPNGFGYVYAEYIEIGQTLDSTANCFLIYIRGTGAQNHLVRMYSGGWGGPSVKGYVGGGYVGQLGVILTSPACTVDLGSSSVIESGNSGKLKLNVQMKNADPSGKVRVWENAVDRQNITPVDVSPSAPFSVYVDDFNIGSPFTVTAQLTTAFGFTIPVATQGNFSGTVSFICAAPSSVTITCPNPISTVGGGPFNVPVSITPGASAASGNITITATATTAGGVRSHSLALPLTLTAAPPPPSLTFSGGQTKSAVFGGSTVFSMVITGNNGWTGPVTLNAFPAMTDFGYCAYLPGGTCTSNPLSRSQVTITPPAVVYFKVTDLEPNPTFHSYGFSVSRLDTNTAVGGVFTLNIGQTASPDLALAAPTSISVPAGGTTNSYISINSQGTYSGTPTVSAPVSVTVAQPMTLNSVTPATNSSYRHSAAGRSPGVYTDSIVVAGHRQDTLVTVSRLNETTPATSCKSSGAVFGFATAVKNNQDGSFYAIGAAAMINHPLETGWTNTVSNVTVSAGNSTVANNSQSSSSTDAQIATIATPNFTNQLGFAAYIVSVDHSHSNASCTIHLDQGDTGILSADAHTVTYLGDYDSWYVPDSSLPKITGVTLDAPLYPGQATTGAIYGLHFGSSQGNGGVSVCLPGSTTCTQTADLTMPKITYWGCNGSSCQINFSINAGSTASGTYDVEVSAGGTNATGFLQPSGGQQKKSDNRGSISLSDPVRITVYLLHGIGQGSPDMLDLSTNLGADPAGLKFNFDSGFDFSSCSTKTNCGSNCSIDAVSQQLAQYITANPPVGNIVLIGYSLGGLIARNMIANGYLHLDKSKSKVIGLITLGTPNLGYPHYEIDNSIFCPQLVKDMAGSWLPLATTPTELSSGFLDSLRGLWSNTFFDGYWLAAAGTQSSSLTRRFPDFPPELKGGCLRSVYSDGVVCLESALYQVSEAKYFGPPGPTATWQDDKEHIYVHTNAYGGWGPGLVFGANDLFTMDQLLYDPTPGSTLFRRILDMLNGK